MNRPKLPIEARRSFPQRCVPTGREIKRIGFERQWGGSAFYNIYATREGHPTVEVFEQTPRYHFLETFGSAEKPSFGNPAGMALDPATGDLLVIDIEDQTLHRFKPNGEPDPFSALSSNVIDGAAGEEDETGSGEILSTEAGSPFEAQVAVAPPGSPGGTEGNIYVTDGLNGSIAIFESSGKFIGEESFIFPCGVATDPAGNVFVNDFEDGVHKLTPTAPATFTESAASPYPETAGGCQVAAGEGFVYPSKFFGETTKVASEGGEEGETAYTVTGEATSTLGVNPGTGNLFTVNFAKMRVSSLF